MDLIGKLRFCGCKTVNSDRSRLLNMVQFIIMKTNYNFYTDAEVVVNSLGQLNQRFSGKRIMLTGAAGFLGVHLTHYFAYLNSSGYLSQPCQLTATDNFLRGYPAWIEELSLCNGIRILREDVIKEKTLQCQDYIIHAASVASPTFYRQYPIETMDANIIGLRNLLNHAVSNPVEGFLFFSSSEIYGDPNRKNIPTPETYRGNVSCTGPRACYDESKRFGETLCTNFFKVHRVPVVTVRPFNNYGPGLRITDKRVLSDFFRDALSGRDIVIFSDGRSTRTFCYVTDAIEGYLRAMLLGRSGEAYNIGSETPEISMDDLAKLVLKITGSPRSVVYRISEDVEYITDSPIRRCPDINKARIELGYQPRISLEDGLVRCHSFYLNHVD